jgi:hypothetical protein
MADDVIPFEKKPLRGWRSRRGWPENVFELLCEEFETTTKGLNVICESHADWPSYYTIVDWMEKDEALAKRMAKAKRVHAMLLIEAAQNIADDVSQDMIETPKGFILNPVAVNRAKLRVDTYKHIAGKFSAEFADKMDVRAGPGVQLTQVFAMPSNGRDELPAIEGEAHELLPPPEDD